MSASLVIAPGTPRGDLQEADVHGLLAERGVPISPEIRGCIRAALAEYSDTRPEPFVRAVASGRAPTHGADGAVAVMREVLHPSERPTQEKRASNDHYSRARVPLVTKGQAIGRLTLPTSGTDGMDVHGRVVPAKPGKKTSTVIDASVKVLPDGTLTATIDGIVELDREGLRVSTTLKLDTVDFSTGNVEFNGSIQVAGEVRDGFRVGANRDIRVRGLIDAATLKAGRDIHLDKGMACPNGGSLSAGRDLRAACLNNVTCEAARDAYIDKELQDCRLIIGRRLIAPNAAIIRGQATVAAGADVGTLGCEAHADTFLWVARAPIIDKLAENVSSMVPTLTTRHQEAKHRLDEILKEAVTHKTAERQTELRFALDSASSLADRLSKGCLSLQEWSSRATKPELFVRREVFPGAKITLGMWTIEVHARVVGPLRFFLGDTGEVMVTDLAVGRTRPAQEIAKVGATPNTPRLDEVASSLRRLKRAA